MKFFKNKSLFLLPIILLCLFILFSINKNKLELIEVDGWFETGYALWKPSNNAYSYKVLYKEKNKFKCHSLDKELIRNYGKFFRVDAPGLKEGKYRFIIIPQNQNNNTIFTGIRISELFDVVSHNRDGFAHYKLQNPIGGYNNDGTLRENAKVVYINAKNVNSIGVKKLIENQIKNSSTPLVIRIIGLISSNNINLTSDNNEIVINGERTNKPLNLTIEGIGNDATLKGIGINIVNAKGIEIRNLGIMLHLEDAISIKDNSKNIWLHNIDFFYGEIGDEKDKLKGDGSIDIINNSGDITVSYCHFVDTGKTSLVGSEEEENKENKITYHHNWFDRSDTRCPKIRKMSAHIYNNFYEKTATYAIGVANGACVFSENNYFNFVKRPMISISQGNSLPILNDKSGGIIKSYNNKNCNKSISYHQNNKSFDIYRVIDRNEKIPSNVTTLHGSHKYNNFDTLPDMYTYELNEVEEVPSIVRSKLGAGRINHGDLKWKYEFELQGYGRTLIKDLKQSLIEYKNSLILD